jgi:hypothetical protein
VLLFPDDSTYIYNILYHVDSFRFSIEEHMEEFMPAVKQIYGEKVLIQVSLTQYCTFAMPDQFYSLSQIVTL